MPLLEEAHKAARTLLDHAYVRIVARAEPDATCAAALLAHALRRENVDFHVSWTRRLDDPSLQGLGEERPDCLVTIGLSGDAAANQAPATKRIALEATTPTLASDATVHDDASLASLAHLVAAGISRRNADLAPLALAGVVAAQRHLGGFRGLDAEVLQEAVDARLILRESALALENGPLVNAITQLDAPYVAGLTGRARNAKKLVADLSLALDMQANALTESAGERLGSFLTLRLLQQNAPDAALDALFRPHLRALQGPHTGLEAGALARMAEAACASGRCGLAFAALWPDPAAAGEVVEVQSAFRDELVAALLRAERDAKREGRLLVAEAPRAALCRPIADRLAIALAPPECITLVHAPDGDGAFLALRAASADAGAAARRVGGVGTHREAHAWVADPTHAVKELVELVA